MISDILDEFPDCKVLSDEVYDFLTFDNVEHIPFASIRDNWRKTITVYSGGKLLNATGWKVGWAIAPPYLLRLGGIMNNTTFYCQNTPAQVAMSNSLDLVDQPSYNGQLSFVEDAKSKFEEVRDFLATEIREMDMPWKPLPCQSGYFLMADVSECRSLVP